ncbi:helix-turn-helix transcriptional regulator [Microbacterium sp. zg.B48]|uniref:helix-turn-helix transcriptional regulator n=1 Tax=Microbacterium sp. zg.B48 TaxID=2969408 RepID=UPI00214B8354|nr:helix-turn-helix transcriptional regulator [Microbacterium sp. zg.B48]MCR2765155.1 helix-turn-helix transcriptional regulator [Microbacterium sp. zg.B48]
MPDGAIPVVDASSRPAKAADLALSAADSRRWMRDLSALLALPAMWVDHEPAEIATGLLSVLAGVLQLEGAYARFHDLPSGSVPLECWRPSGSTPPPEFRILLDTGAPGAGTTTTPVRADGRRTVRVTSVPLALPWESGLVLVSSEREDFPTAMETHLLRIAVSQAAIAIHTARRIGREHAARVAAEAALRRQHELVRALAEDVGPSFAALTRRMQEAAQLQNDVDSLLAALGADTGLPSVREAVPPAPAGGTSRDGVRSAVPSLTRRETEVLGLLAQGLSNKEIAGMMWLSDRTVERHVTSLYRKIGVARRSEATAFAFRHGLA